MKPKKKPSRVTRKCYAALIGPEGGVRETPQLLGGDEERERVELRRAS